MLSHLRISPRIVEKLEKKHAIIPIEVAECFMNRVQGLLEDTRVNHKTQPPTLWFIAPTDMGRLLKVVFIELIDHSYEIKTAYEPNNTEVEIYERYA